MPKKAICGFILRKIRMSGLILFFCETDSDAEEKWVYMKSKRVGRAMREWVECDLDNMSWPSIETGLNAKIFDGQSLLEVLDKVTFI